MDAAVAAVKLAQRPENEGKLIVVSVEFFPLFVCSLFLFHHIQENKSCALIHLNDLYPHDE